MKNMKRSIALVVAIALMVGCAIGGTMAWLMDTSDQVTNTFTTSDVDIELKETKGTLNGTNREFKMVPGATIEKDPTVTVLAGSEACWLFVKVEESTDFDDYMTYTMADGWETLDATNNPGVYYRAVDATTAAAGESFAILGDGTYTDPMGTTSGDNATDDDVTITWADNQVAVKPSVTKAMMDAFDTNGDGELSDSEKNNLPKLTFTAYAVQKEAKNTAADAWTLAQSI